MPKTSFSDEATIVSIIESALNNAGFTYDKITASDGTYIFISHSAPDFYEYTFIKVSGLSITVGVCSSYTYDEETNTVTINDQHNLNSKTVTAGDGYYNSTTTKAVAISLNGSEIVVVEKTDINGNPFVLAGFENLRLTFKTGLTSISIVGTSSKTNHYASNWYIYYNNYIFANLSPDIIYFAGTLGDVCSIDTTKYFSLGWNGIGIKGDGTEGTDQGTFTLLQEINVSLSSDTITPQPSYLTLSDMPMIEPIVTDYQTEPQESPIALDVLGRITLKTMKIKLDIT